MAKKSQYTFIDLFAGCGGLSEGFMESGHFKGLAHIEWEYPMVQTLRNRLVKKWNETCEQAQKKVILFDIQRTDELLFGNWTQESIKQYAKYNSVETQKGLKHILNGKTVDDADKIRKDLWNTVNSREKVNINLLYDDDIQTIDVDGKKVIAISTLFAWSFRN